MDAIWRTSGTKTQRLKNMLSIVSQDLSKRCCGVEFRNDDLYRLLSHHPEAIAKGVPEYRSFTLNTTMGSRTLYVVGNDGITQSISREVACRAYLGLKANNKNGMLAAMRQAIWDKSRLQYLMSHPENECGHQGASHLDHTGTPFCRIVDCYLATHPQPSYSQRSAGIYILDDPESWITHHESIAQFRRVCAACNLAAGSTPPSDNNPTTHTHIPPLA